MTAIGAEFNLRAALRAYMEAIDERDPRAIAAGFFDMLEDEQLRDAGAQAAVLVVQNLQAGRRIAHRNYSDVSGRVAGKSKYDPSRWTGDVESIKAILAETVHVPGGDSKSMLECSALDFDKLAADRAVRAAAMEAESDRFAMLATIVRAHNKTRLCDCPDAAIHEAAEVWNDA